MLFLSAFDEVLISTIEKWFVLVLLQRDHGTRSVFTLPPCPSHVLLANVSMKKGCSCRSKPKVNPPGFAHGRVNSIGPDFPLFGSQRLYGLYELAPREIYCGKFSSITTSLWCKLCVILSYGAQPILLASPILNRYYELRPMSDLFLLAI